MDIAIYLHLGTIVIVERFEKGIKKCYHGYKITQMIFMIDWFFSKSFFITTRIIHLVMCGKNDF